MPIDMMIADQAAFDFDIKGQVRLNPDTQEFRLYIAAPTFKEVGESEDRQFDTADPLFKRPEKVWDSIAVVLNEALAEDWLNFTKVGYTKRQFDQIPEQDSGAQEAV